MRGKIYNFWLIVRQAPDLPGQWTAHCLELDVVTQGNSLPHAIEMAREAVVLTVEADVEAGRDPLERRAPDEFFAELYDALDRSHPVDRNGLASLAMVPDALAIAQIVVAVAQPKDAGRREPVPWMALAEPQPHA